MSYLKKLLPLFVLLFTASLLTMLWYSGKVRNDEMLKMHVLSLLEGSKARLTEAVKIRLSVLHALSEHFQGHLRAGEFGERMFYMITESAYQSLEGFQTVNWVNKDGTVKWVYPPGENGPLKEENLRNHPERAVREAFERAEESRSFVMTPVIELQGGPGVATFYPVTDKDGEIRGYVNGVFKMIPLIDYSITDKTDCDFSVKQGGWVLLSSNNSTLEREDGDRKVEAAVVEIPGLVLTIRMWPTERLVSLYEGEHRWPTLTALLFIALALSYSVYKLQGHYVELKTKDRKLQESEIKFRSLVEHSLAGIYLIQDGLFRYVNPRFCEIFGYGASEIINKMGPKDLTFPPDRPLVEENLRKRLEGLIEAANYTFKAVRAGGEVFDVEVYGARTQYNGRPAIIGMLLDITERKILEEQLRQSQKLESIGSLAGGIAHDFNNILTAITGYASLLNMKLKDEALKVQVEQILKASERAAGLTQGLLAFSRKQILQPRPLHLGDIIKDFVKILRGVISENIEIEIALDDKRPVMADPVQIEQVVMNLAANARDAMPGGGRLIIETFEMPFDEAYLERHKWVHKGGDFVCLSVTDTGVGMDDVVKKHIFEPFFTTKGVGKGTGLGLSTVYGIVKQHNGFIHVYSEKGKGTTFKIYFPVTESAPVEVNHLSESSTRGGTETILLAEDEDNVRQMIEEALKEYGYTVVVAMDGNDAMTLLGEKFREIDLMLLDVVMPKGGGREVYELAKSLGYRGEVIFISGYTINAIHKNFVLEKGLNFLTKPFSPVILARKVREVLDKGKKQ